MDRHSNLKDFYIEHIKLSISNIFSFDCETELLSDEFTVNILEEIYIKRIPIWLKIMPQNILDDYSEVVYSFLKEKIEETNDLIDKIDLFNKANYHSAKLNGVKFKLGGNIFLMSISLKQEPELRDDLKRFVKEYIGQRSLKSFEMFLNEFISNIEGIEKCLGTIEKVLEITSIPKEVIDKFTRIISMKNKKINVFKNASSSPVNQSSIDNNNSNNRSLVKNETIHTFLSKKRYPSREIQVPIENNETIVMQSDKGKNKVIEDYFKVVDIKIKNSNISNNINAVDNSNNIINTNLINDTNNTYKRPISKKTKRRMSQTDNELRETTQPILDFISFSKAGGVKNANNNIINSPIYSSLQNSFYKSSTHSNSFRNFNVNLLNNNEKNTMSKPILSNPTLRGINSRLSSNSIMQKFTIKKKKKQKKNNMSERIIEKCKSNIEPMMKQKETKPNQENEKINYLKKMLKTNFYTNHSNFSSVCNSKENSNNVPWIPNLNDEINKIRNDINSDTKDNSGNKELNKYETKINRNREIERDNHETNENDKEKKIVEEEDDEDNNIRKIIVDDDKDDKERKNEEEDDEDEILVYKTPKKIPNDSYDYSVNQCTLKKNLYALFTQTIK